MTLVIKDFFAEWCGPCRAQTPIIEGLEKEFSGKGVEFKKINVDENQEEAAKYGVTAIPTIVFEKDGKKVEVLQGLNSRKKLKDLIEKHK